MLLVDVEFVLASSVSDGVARVVADEVGGLKRSCSRSVSRNAEL